MTTTVTARASRCQDLMPSVHDTSTHINGPGTVPNSLFPRYSKSSKADYTNQNTAHFNFNCDSTTHYNSECSNYIFEPSTSNVLRNAEYQRSDGSPVSDTMGRAAALRNSTLTFTHSDKVNIRPTCSLLRDQQPLKFDVLKTSPTHTPSATTTMTQDRHKSKEIHPDINPHPLSQSSRSSYLLSFAPTVENESGTRHLSTPWADGYASQQNSHGDAQKSLMDCREFFNSQRSCVSPSTTIHSPQSKTATTLDTVSSLGTVQPLSHTLLDPLSAKHQTMQHQEHQAVFFERNEKFRSNKTPTDLAHQKCKERESLGQTIFDTTPCWQRLVSAPMQQSGSNTNKILSSSSNTESSPPPVFPTSQDLNCDDAESSAWSSVANQLLSSPSLPPLCGVSYNGSVATPKSFHDSSGTPGGPSRCSTPASTERDTSEHYLSGATVSSGSTCHPSGLSGWRSAERSPAAKSPTFSTLESAHTTASNFDNAINGLFLNGLHDVRRTTFAPSVSATGYPSTTSTCGIITTRGASVLLESLVPKQDSLSRSDAYLCPRMSSTQNEATSCGLPAHGSRRHTAFRFKSDTVLEKQYLSENDNEGDDDDKTDEKATDSTVALLNSRGCTISQTSKGCSDASVQNENSCAQHRSESSCLGLLANVMNAVTMASHSEEETTKKEIFAADANTTPTLENLLIDAFLNSSQAPGAFPLRDSHLCKSPLIYAKPHDVHSDSHDLLTGASVVSKSKTRTSPAVRHNSDNCVLREMHPPLGYFDGSCEAGIPPLQKLPVHSVGMPPTMIRDPTIILSPQCPRAASMLSNSTFHLDSGQKGKYSTPFINDFFALRYDGNGCFQQPNFSNTSNTHCFNVSSRNPSRVGSPLVVPARSAPAHSHLASVCGTELEQRCSSQLPSTQQPWMFQHLSGRSVKFFEANEEEPVYALRSNGITSSNVDLRARNPPARKSITLPPTCEANTWLTDHLRMQFDALTDGASEPKPSHNSGTVNSSSSSFTSCRRPSSVLYPPSAFTSGVPHVEYDPVFHRLFQCTLEEGKRTSSASDPLTRAGLIQKPQESPENSSSLLGSFTTPASMAQNQEKLHAQRRCKPCAFFYNKKKGCRNGSLCEFCHHEDHSKLALKQWKKQQQKMMKMILASDTKPT